MANTYHWDFAFDMNAVTRDTLNKGISEAYLQSGFAQFNGTTATPATPANLGNGDIVQYFLYDVTVPNSTTPASYQVTSAKVKFAPANTGMTLTTPLSSGGKDLAVASYNNGSPVPSILFGGGTAPGSVNYMAWSLGATGGYTISNTGRFLMTLEVVVSVPNSTNPTQTITFKVDPEMVTGAWG